VRICVWRHLYDVIHIFSHPTVWRTRRNCHDDLGRPRRKKLHSKRHELLVRRIVSIVIVLHVRQTRFDLLYWSQYQMVNGPKKYPEKV